MTTGYLFTVEDKLVVPGERKTHRNYITYLWKELIKDGLGIDRTLYSLKSRGNNDRKQDNKMSDDAIAFLFGHSDKGMSRKHYHRDKLGAYRKNNLLIFCNVIRCKLVIWKLIKEL